MNRREALQAALGTAVGAASIPVAAADVVEVKRPFLAVIRCDQRLCIEQMAMLNQGRLDIDDVRRMELL